jgi:hypothetical protein
MKEIGRPKVASGTGNPLMAGIGDTKKAEAGFNSKTERFVDGVSDNIGPGSYTVKDGMTKYTNLGGSLPRDKRGENPIEPNPGPGTYFEEEVDNPWNKKSFNIIFSELSSF